MKIMIINPDWGMSAMQMEKRLEVLSYYVGKDTYLSMRCLTKTKVCLDSCADGVMAGPEILQIAMETQEKGYDAIVLYCFSDPVLEACRQAVSVPVVGAGQAAYLMVPTVAYQAAVILSDAKRIPEKKLTLSRTGLSSERIVGFEAVNIKGMDPIQDNARLTEELLEAGKRALEKTGAQALVLGCLSFLGTGKKLEEKLQVPVIDPGPISVVMAESMVRLGLSSSKKAYLKRSDMTYGLSF